MPQPKGALKKNVSVLFNQETFWLSQQRMAELFGVTNADISYHLIQIENNGKLHLSDCIQKNLIPSEQWDEQGVTQSSSLLEYSAMARIFVQVSAIELAHIAERSRKCQKKIALLRNNNEGSKSIYHR